MLTKDLSTIRENMRAINVFSSYLKKKERIKKVSI